MTEVTYSEHADLCKPFVTLLVTRGIKEASFVFSSIGGRRTITEATCDGVTLERLRGYESPNDIVSLASELLISMRAEDTIAEQESLSISVTDEGVEILRESQPQVEQMSSFCDQLPKGTADIGLKTLRTTLADRLELDYSTIESQPEIGQMTVYGADDESIDIDSLDPEWFADALWRTLGRHGHDLLGGENGYGSVVIRPNGDIEVAHVSCVFESRQERFLLPLPETIGLVALLSC